MNLKLKCLNLTSSDPPRRPRGRPKDSMNKKKPLSDEGFHSYEDHISASFPRSTICNSSRQATTTVTTMAVLDQPCTFQGQPKYIMNHSKSQILSKNPNHKSFYRATEPEATLATNDQHPSPRRGVIGLKNQRTLSYEEPCSSYNGYDLLSSSSHDVTDTLTPQNRSLRSHRQPKTPMNHNERAQATLPQAAGRPDGCDMKYIPPAESYLTANEDHHLHHGSAFNSENLEMHSINPTEYDEGCEIVFDGYLQDPLYREAFSSQDSGSGDRKWLTAEKHNGCQTSYEGDVSCLVPFLTDSTI